ncbi:LysR family transcriptional regulator [Salmonella enterica subsp. arizonae]|uniref:LysR family transcriptional regulator n=1 Tax=Salmonella enterica subsp. arizonae TaxID=59203 RepID=A0A379TD11_SALER|nr:LysR family transcriptional regulator [Salmonella enterica subsp. arizonae]
MLVEAQAAQDAIAALQVEPRGIVKLTCPGDAAACTHWPNVGEVYGALS